MMNEKEVETLLKETKAILEGHFLLTSGLHSPLYVEKFNVLQHPEYTEKLCRKLQNISRTRNRNSYRTGYRRNYPLAGYCKNPWSQIHFYRT